MEFRTSVLGFAVGLLVGLTGMGGGAVMTPALILLGWAKPVMAVGTDLVWGTVTKAAGAFVHWRQGTVDLKIVKRLALGSIPGALAGLVLMGWLHRSRGEIANVVVVRMLGGALICVALTLFVRCLLGSQSPAPRFLVGLRRPQWVIPLVGAVIGFLVSLTSVGSGSLIVACLAVLYPSTPLRRLVGSDLFHAVILVGVSALGHLGIGSVDARLLGGLLVGSLPGVWVGGKLSGAFPEKVLRPILATTLLGLGCRLL